MDSVHCAHPCIYIFRSCRSRYRYVIFLRLFKTMKGKLGTSKTYCCFNTCRYLSFFSSVLLIQVIWRPPNFSSCRWRSAGLISMGPSSRYAFGHFIPSSSLISEVDPHWFLLFGSRSGSWMRMGLIRIRIRVVKGCLKVKNNFLQSLLGKKRFNL